MKIWSLFEGFGVELEYMIADKKTLDLMSKADVLVDETGDYLNGAIDWSNELALHVIELKTHGPATDLPKALAAFQKNITEMNHRLESVGACLLPGAAHPWMKPEEANLWPHECNDVYSAYDRLFSCKGHGWVNLQSTHLNLPFSNDEEFKKLHTAIRLVLPLLPALAASSPFLEGKPTGLRDTRLHYYNINQQSVPQIAGHIIPERVSSQAEYWETILKPSFDAIEAEDSEGILRREWLNSRGAIARFERMAIEIRILDIQENPSMDIAIVALIVELLKALVSETWAPFDVQWSFAETHLAQFYHAAIEHGFEARVNDLPYLELFGLEHPSSMRAIWRAIVDRLSPNLGVHLEKIEFILKHGSLSDRMLKAYSRSPNHETLAEIYRALSHCLAEGKPYQP